MKKVTLLLFILSMSYLFFTCTKDNTVAPLTQTNAALLAGSNGGSKNWKIASIMYSEVGNGSFTVTPTTTTDPTNFSIIPGCEADNIYTFSNDLTQSYSYAENTTKCASTDSTIIESGHWALTSNGKALLIEDGVYNLTQTQNSSSSEPYIGLIVLNQGIPLTISSISATSLTLTYSGTYTNTTTNTLVNYTTVLVLTSTN